MEQLPYLSFLAGNHRPVLGSCLRGATGIFCSPDLGVFVCSGPRSPPQPLPESGQTRSPNSPCSSPFPAQATSAACPAKGPFGPSTPAAFLHPRPTSAPRSAPPLGSLHLGGGCCLKAASRNVSIPRFQVSSKLLGMKMPLAAQHGSRSSRPSALKLQRAAEIPSGMQKSPWEPHRSQPGILGCGCTS